MECTTVKNTSTAIRAIGDALRNGSNWEDALIGLADDSVELIKDKVKEFIKRIENSVGMSISDYITDSVKNRRDFLRIWNGIEKSLLDEFADVAPNKYAEIDKTTNDVKLEFGKKDVTGYDRVSTQFKQSLADCAVFHINTVGRKVTELNVSLSGDSEQRNRQLNKNIHDYKINLLNQIRKYVDIDIDPNFDMNDAAFTEMIVNALTAFEDRYNNDTSSDSDTRKAAHDAYVTLKYFDVFLKDLNFIETKESYKNSAGYGPNMYEYVGFSSNPVSHFGKDDPKDAAKINSPLLSLIFDNMPELATDDVLKRNPGDKQQMVTANGFIAIMSKFKSWLYSKGKADALSDLDETSLLNELKSFLAAHSNPTPEFLPYITRYPDKIRGIIKVLGSDGLGQKFIQDIWKHVATNEAMSYTMYDEKNGKIRMIQGKQRVIDVQELKILDKIRNAVFEYSYYNKDGFTALCEKYGIRYGGKREGVYLFTDKNGNSNVRLRLDSNDKITLEYYFGTDEKGIDIWSSSNTVKVGSTTKSIDIDSMNQNAKSLIEELLGMIPDGWQQYTDDSDLLDLFSTAVGTTLLALDPNATKHGHNVFQFNRIGTDKIKYLNTSTRHFKGKLRKLSEMFASAYGSDITVTLKNLKGDSIPAFTLTSWIFGLPRTCSKLQKEASREGVKNAFSKNFVYSNYLKVGQPFVRRDAAIKGVQRSSSQYSENEVSYLGIMADFFGSLYDTNNKSILFQNTTNSDKSTHWVIPYAKDITFYNGETLEKTVKDIIKGDKGARTVIAKTLYDCRKGEYTNIAINLINKYNDAFGWFLSTDEDEILDSIEIIANIVDNFQNIFETTVKDLIALDSATDPDIRRSLQIKIINDFNKYVKQDLSALDGDIDDSIDVINNFVEKFKLNRVKSVEEAFNRSGVEHVNELHSSNGKFNKTLLNELRLYCGTDSNVFTTRLAKQLDYFIQDLANGGFELNIYDDEAVFDLFEQMGEDKAKWLDPKTGDVIFKVGNEYNPFLVAYFLTDVLCSTEYNKLVDGFTWMHPAKYKAKLQNGDFKRTDGKASTGAFGEKISLLDGSVATVDNNGNLVANGSVIDTNLAEYHENYFIHESAARLSASYKRTVINGASIEAFVPQEHGIDTEFLFAEVKDIPGKVWNMVGNKDDKLKSMDGSAFVNPIFAILCGWSSPNGEIAFDKKTICGDISAEYGVPSLFKWAEFGLTNDRRRMSYMSDASAENLFEITSSIPLNQYVKLEDFYGYSRNSQNKTTFAKSDKKLYKQDPFTKKIYLISDIKTSQAYTVEDGKTVPFTKCEYSLTEVDESGNVIGKSVRESKNITTLYDIDQVLGGAFAMELKSGKLEYSDANNYILAELVCDRHLKDKFVAYVVNSSAMKVGNRNTNSIDIFNSAYGRKTDGKFDHTKLLTSKASSYGLGKQMDPDHELEFAEVSEMSQMISALIQGGHYTSLVKRIYSEIGKVAAQEMRLMLDAVSKNDADKIYQLLGESLMDAFETGNRNTTGLAQSFLIKAKMALNDANIKYEIPFSAPTINATFVSDLISTINKKGIRRKYSGIASVLVPSHNMIQYYRYGGKTLMFTQFAKQVIKDFPRDDVKNDQSIEDGINKNKQHVYKLMNDASYALKYGALVKYDGNQRPDSEDTVVMITRDAEGKIIDTKTLKIDSFETFDEIRNFLPDNVELYNWTVKPKNLRQFDQTFDIEVTPGNVKTFSIYELDSVRASYYVRELSEKPVNKINNYSEKLNVVKSALAHAGITWDGTTIPRNLDPWIKVIDAQVKTDLKTLDTGGFIDNQVAFGIVSDDQIAFSNVKARYAEMVMGRFHAEELGLTSDDDLAKIKELGEEFFEERLKGRRSINEAKDVYDYAVTTTTGHTIYVSIRKNHKKSDLSRYHVPNKSFTQESTGIWYNHSEKISDFISDNCAVVSIQDKIKQVCPLIIVDSEEEAERFIHGEGVDFIHYNVNRSNFKYLASQLLASQIDNGITIGDWRKDEPVILTNDIINNFDNLSDDAKDAYIKSVKTILEKNNERKLKQLAHRQWLAFQQQLSCVGARIPTQSMQSFQALEIVGFSNSTKNEVYVPKSQTWLQGSDYDVDKLYIMTYYLAKNGTLPTFSRLETEPGLKNLAQVLRLESPNGRHYSEFTKSLETLEDGTNIIFDDVAIEKQSIVNTDAVSYKIFSANNPDAYIEFINDPLTTVYQITTSNFSSIKDAIALFKAFIEMCPEGSVYTTNGDMVHNQILTGILRSDYCVENEGLIVKNPDLKKSYKLNISKDQVTNAIQLENFDCFNDIMASKSSFITFDDDVTFEERREFLRLLNKHTQSGFAFTFDWAHNDDINISNEEIDEILNGNFNVIKKFESEGRLDLKFDPNTSIERICKVIDAFKEYRQNAVKTPDVMHALQNSVLGGILNLLDKATVQPYGHNPISMDDIKSLVGSDETELRMNMDNAYTKFMMQVQNMVGKEVIGISAVSMKVFFAASTYFNSELDLAVDSYKDCDDTLFTRHLANILFVDYTGDSPELNTMANLNLEPLKALLKNGQDILIPLTALSKIERNRLAPALSKYMANGKLSLRALLNGRGLTKGIIEKSQTQDAAQNISELLSAATDNAKELILAKINATSEFADIWSALLMTGHSFQEIDKMMKSPFFNEIVKLSKGFMMSDLHKGVNSKNVIKFMNLDGNLPSINAKALRFAIGAHPSSGLNKCFYYKMFYETDENGKLLTRKNGKLTAVTSESDKKVLIPKAKPLTFYKPDESGNLQRVVVNAEYLEKLETQDSTTLKTDLPYWLTSPEVVAEFEKHLISLLPNTTASDILSGNRGTSQTEDSYDENDYNEFESDAEQDFEIYDDEDLEGYAMQETYSESANDYRMLLRYTRKFLKARANILSDNFNRFGEFHKFVEKVLPMTEEQNITGAELGVNQGLPTNEFDFYNKLLRIENFVNKRYKENEVDEDFDIIKFIEDDVYRESQIEKYEDYKFAINPLAIISKVPNFAQMFKFYSTAYKMLGRSAQFKLDFAFAKNILKHDGTKRLNADEFKAVHETIKDSLILSWLKQQNIQITLPSGQLRYLPTSSKTIGEYFTNVPQTISLDNPENLATFKHFMDTYVFPALKDDIDRPGHPSTTNFGKNDFVRIIDSTVKLDKLHQQLELRKRMPLDMMSIDESSTSKDLFNHILESFGEIAEDTTFLKNLGISDGSITLGDLIYLYNLYVYKDSFSQDSFTRMFEIMNVYNSDALINKYYTWVSKIDEAMSNKNIDDVEDFEIQIDENQTLRFSIKQKDILYRLSKLENADKRIGITAIFTNDAITGIQFTDKYGNPVGRILSVKCKNASDFRMELPFSTDWTMTAESEGFTGDDVKQRFLPNDAQVLNETMNLIDEICNIDSEVVVEITSDDIAYWQENPEKSPLDLSDSYIAQRVNRGHGFIYDGKIYINTSNPNYKANTKIHELSHAVCAMLKYSKKASDRDMYYNLIDKVYKSFTKEELTDVAKNMGFKTINNPDFKEELLVDQIATAFKDGIDSSVFDDENRFSKTTLKQKLKTAIEQMFDVDMSSITSIEKIGNSEISTIVAMFGKAVQSFDNNSLRMNLIHSAEAKAFKNYLIKTTESEFNRSKEGIYYTC